MQGKENVGERDEDRRRALPSLGVAVEEALHYTYEARALIERNTVYMADGTGLIEGRGGE